MHIQQACHHFFGGWVIKEEEPVGTRFGLSSAYPRQTSGVEVLFLDSNILPSHFILLWLMEEMALIVPFRPKWNRTEWF